LTLTTEHSGTRSRDNGTNSTNLQTIVKHSANRVLLVAGIVFNINVQKLLFLRLPWFLNFLVATPHNILVRS
jgi:hypothetical protein